MLNVGKSKISNVEKWGTTWGYPLRLVFYKKKPGDPHCRGRPIELTES